jgi:hypothetical protein
MKRLLVLVPIFIGTFSLNVYAREFPVGIPSSVTQTTTPISIAYVESSQNSRTAWTKLAGSSETHLRFFIYEPTGTYDLLVSYNSNYNNVTYATAANDCFRVKAGTVSERYLYLPNGVYVNLTFNTKHSGTTLAPNVMYESQK